MIVNPEQSTYSLANVYEVCLSIVPRLLKAKIQMVYQLTEEQLFYIHAKFERQFSFSLFTVRHIISSPKVCFALFTMDKNINQNLS